MGGQGSNATRIPLRQARPYWAGQWRRVAAFPRALHLRSCHPVGQGLWRATVLLLFRTNPCAEAPGASVRPLAWRAVPSSRRSGRSANSTPSRLCHDPAPLRRRRRRRAGSPSCARCHQANRRPVRGGGGAVVAALSLPGGVPRGPGVRRWCPGEGRPHRANLAGADLMDVDLKEANLTGANLQRANLTRANLKGVHAATSCRSDAGGIAGGTYPLPGGLGRVASRSRISSASGI